MAIKTDAELATLANLITTPSAVSAGYIYIAFYSNYQKVNATDLRSQKREIGRLALTKTLVGAEITADYTMGTTDCNCPFSTVATSGSNTATSFKVTDYTQFAVNDRVAVGSEKDRMITAINSSTHFITLDAPLTAIPADGTTVNVKISQRAVLRGGTSSANTGELAIIENWILFKSSAIGPIPGRIKGPII